MTPEREEELKRTAEFVKAHVQRTRMCSLDEVDTLARGVLSLLAENEALTVALSSIFWDTVEGDPIHETARVALKTSAPPRAG